MKRIFALLLAALLCTSCAARTMTPASTQSHAAPDSKTESALPQSEAAAPSSSVSEAPSKQETPAQDASPDDWRLLLVNPWHKLEQEPAIDLVMTSYGYEVDARIVDDLDDMMNAAAKDGVQLLICYGYRTFAQSEALFEKQVNRQLAANPSYTREQAVEAAKKWVAPPGTSDHHTGLALDIVTPSNQVLDDRFAQTDAAKWMAAHGWEYGFVIRFPADKTEQTGIAYESWHLRYVGADHARVMHEKNLCLEEYVEALADKTL